MRPKLLLFVVLVVGIAFAMADFDGLIDIDEDTDDRVSQNIEKRSVESFDGEGDDEDYGSAGIMSDESGSGSGNETTTDKPIVDVSVVSPTAKESTATTEKTTTIDNEIPEDTEEPTEEEITDRPFDGDGDGDVYGGGVSETDAPNEDDSPNAEARVDEKSALRVLTTEVIAAVVVGAVCAVILIAFLVYRLRKRDEGSYALSDAGYKDTYKLQGDTGKEAFV